ncbi:MAG TPA: adenylyltransferase/cytidyltransferase family protein, partial [Chitinophagaceae bacterium]|nr:adenylyltransferase/cytidyltransferase family protein [Chitinophagaceae bacterium]
MQALQRVSSMQVHRDIENLPAFPRAVVTIGTFDGVHLGHRQILRQMKEVAGAQGGQTVIITFDPHPREVLRPSPNQPGILNTLDEKISLLAEQGMDHLVVVPFTTAFSQLSPEAFIRDFLVRRFHPRTMIIGYDHHFGHDRKGDIGLLCRYGTILGFEVLEIPPRVVHEVTVSSTRIRQDIRDGNLEEASELLGYPYFFSGTVVAGARV